MKKKILLFVSILLSFFLVIFIFFLPQNPDERRDETGLFLPPKFSFRDFVKQTSSPTTFIAVGDIMLGRYCNIQMLKNKDWKYPFSKTAELFKPADIVFGNLEAPFFNNCPATETGMIFCARPESIEGLKSAGFNILSIANNHILNYGQTGLEQTKNFLTQNYIKYSGPNNLAIQQFNNLSFGFLSFDLATYPATPVLDIISQNISQTDVLIVSLHWGTEYSKTPSQNQTNLAHQIIDAGAKIIIGHHPHVIQPVEKYNNGLIFYSLGNFIFDQAWSEETKKGTVAKIVFEGEKIKSYETIPVYSESYCQPTPL